MRTLYDSVTPTNILKANPNPQMVAGYINGPYAWTAAEWALFPQAVKVRISVRANFLDGHVLDVEPGDATPAQSVDWVLARRRAGAEPTVYCNRSTWVQVQAAFRARGVPEPHYWIATASGKAEIPAGAVAAQYLLDIAPGIDVTAAADYWPGVDPTPTNPTPGKDPISMIRIPKGGSQDAPASFPLAMSMLWEHDVIIAPGKMPVVLFHAYNWDWEVPGTGGDPGRHVVPVDGSFSFIVPSGTGKCDLLYWADDDFTVAVERRV